MSISVVIPTLNACGELDELLTKLEQQTVAPTEILVIDSSSEDGTLQIAERHPGVRTYSVSGKEFNHGGTRDLAFSMTSGEIVVFMTQDAMPVSNMLIEKLVAPLREEATVAAYARQLPKPTATAREKLIRAFNYPEQSERHTLNDLSVKGIKTFFLSDVSAAYRRKEYEALGGFEKDVLSNEDMLYAARAIRAGYTIAYAADAEVLHSHNLSPGEQYRRNWVQGYEIERHRELLKQASSANEGMAMLRTVSGQLLRQGKILSAAGLLIDCAARYAGSKAGQRAYRKNNRREQDK